MNVTWLSIDYGQSYVLLFYPYKSKLLKQINDHRHSIIKHKRLVTVAADDRHKLQQLHMSMD